MGAALATRGIAALGVSLALAFALAGCDGEMSGQASGGGPVSAGSLSSEADSTADSSATEAQTGPIAAPERRDAPRSDEDVSLWFMAGEQYLAVERTVPADAEPGAVPGPLEAVEALLEGPQPGDEPVPREDGGEGAVAGVEVETQAKAEVRTLIPAGTELIGLNVGEGREAVVDLSPTFLTGIPKREGERTAAEERELSARVGQVVYTVTQFAGISSAEVRTGGITIANESKPADYAPSKPKPKPVETLRPGAEPTAATRQLQRRLAQLRYLPSGSGDGIYGDQTAQAVMAFQAWQGLDRDGIAGPVTHRELAKGKIPRPEADGARRRVEIHLDEGVVLLVRGGRTIRAIHASGGAPGYETPRGTFEVFRKELMSWSVPYSVWMPYASYFNGGIALHESASVPAYPASHGCVRVPPSEAKLVYNFAGPGTTVVVL